MPETDVYLGDSVYASFDGYLIRIYTNNGFGPQNEIYLEPEVYAALEKFAKSNYKGA